MVGVEAGYGLLLSGTPIYIGRPNRLISGLNRLLSATHSYSRAKSRRRSDWSFTLGRGSPLIWLFRHTSARRSATCGGDRALTGHMRVGRPRIW